MTRSMRHRTLAGAAVVALVIGGASLAWACTRLPTITLSPSAGRAGSQTQVTGKAFLPAEPIEVHWNGIEGDVIAHAIGPDFSVAVTIPAGVADGVYYLVATAPGSRAQTSFQVRTRTTTSGSPEGDGQTANSANGADGTASGTGSNSASTAGGTNSAGVGEQNGELSFGSAGQAAAAGQAATTPAAAGQTATAPSAQSATAAAPSAARSSASAAQSATAAAPVPGATPVPADDETASPAPRSATADLWSGFSAGNTGSLMAPGIDTPASNSTTPMAVGVGVLSLGMAALGLGFGAAELRRRRSVAGPNA